MDLGYDGWKEIQKQDPEPATYCVQCGVPLYGEDALYTVDGGMCEDCLECSLIH